MHCLDHLFALGPLLWMFSLLLPSTTASPSHPSTSQLPFQIARDTFHADSRQSWFNLARDNVIQTIWRVPAKGSPSRTLNKPSISSSPPPTVLARYGGDLVLRFEISSIEQVEALAEAIDVLFLDVWEFTAEWVDIRLSKDVVPSLLGLLPPSLQRAHTRLMHDLAQAIFGSYPSIAFVDPSAPIPEASRPFSPDLRPTSGETNIFFREYQPLSVIVPWMRLMRSLFPTHVRMTNIGLSYEGREIPALRVGVHSTNSEKPSGPRKIIIIAGGSHAREWISTSTVNFVAYSFITGYGKSKSITKLMEQFDWVFIPTLNPDGYVYTWENDRLWRKNRQQTSLRFCRGVDLDRSYAFEWDGQSSKNNPCSESFSGESPFQAVESRRLANWARNETDQNNAEIVGFLDFHSYSQQVLYPYSYSCTSAPPSLENLEELAIGLAKAIRVTNGNMYEVTSACEGSVTNATDIKNLQALKREQASDRISWPRMKAGGGSALDWFYQELKVPYAYQIKLRDTGSYGFLLPSKNIVPTGREALGAVEYLGQYLLGNKGIENSEGARGVNDVEISSPQEEFSAPERYEFATEHSYGEESNLEENEVANWELRRRRRR